MSKPEPLTPEPSSFKKPMIEDKPRHKRPKRKNLNSIINRKKKKKSLQAASTHPETGMQPH